MPANAASKTPDLKPARNHAQESHNLLVQCEVGDLLAPLRRVQIAIKRADADIGFLAGDKDTAKLVVIDGPEFVCSTPLGFAVPQSFVVRKSLLLKTLVTFKADQLQEMLRLYTIRTEGQISFLKCVVGQGTKAYNGTFAVIPDEAERYERTLANLATPETANGAIQVSKAAFFAALRRVLPPAKIKFSANLSNVFVERSEKGLFMSAACNTFAARFCVATQALTPGMYPVAVDDMEVIADGIKDQVIGAEDNIEIRFSQGQLAFRCGKIEYTVRCTSAQLPPLDRLIVEKSLAWGITLPKPAAETLMAGLNAMSDEKGQNFGFRFEGDDNDEGVMMKAIGSTETDAEIELVGGKMVGAMPANFMFKPDILVKTMAFDAATETLQVMGYGDVQHVHVKDPSTSGVVVMMPAMV